MTHHETPTFVARTPADLIALVPVVLGFHPEDSVVLLTFGPPGGSFHARVDLPVAADEQGEVARLLLGAVLANEVERVALVVYTDDVAVAEVVGRAVVEPLLEHDIGILDVLRVDAGQWFAVPEEGDGGTAYDLETHPFTAQQVFAGQVVHRDRAALADTLVGTDDEDATAVALAATRHADLLRATGAAGEAHEPGLLRTEARWVQRRVREAVADGRRLDVASAGRLLVLAALVPTRDVAWSEITRATSRAHVELWRDLVRRTPPDLLPGAAALLAFAAWQHGDGALAWCALDRCLEADPDYSMAHCVAGMLTRAVPPSVWEPIPEDDLPVFRDPSPGGPAALGAVQSTRGRAS